MVANAAWNPFRDGALSGTWVTEVGLTSGVRQVEVVSIDSTIELRKRKTEMRSLDGQLGEKLT